MGIEVPDPTGIHGFAIPTRHEVGGSLARQKVGVGIGKCVDIGDVASITRFDLRDDKHLRIGNEPFRPAEMVTQDTRSC